MGATCTHNGQGTGVGITALLSNYCTLQNAMSQVMSTRFDVNMKVEHEMRGHKHASLSTKRESVHTSYRYSRANVRCKKGLHHVTLCVWSQVRKVVEDSVVGRCALVGLDNLRSWKHLPSHCCKWSHVYARRVVAMWHRLMDPLRSRLPDYLALRSCHCLGARSCNISPESNILRHNRPKRSAQHNMCRIGILDYIPQEVRQSL